jgi:hypothetical protein
MGPHPAVDNVTDGAAPLERAGLRNVRRTPALGVPLLMMALIGTQATRFRSGCRC